MKIQCNVCETAEAVVLCCADEAALCHDCDEKVHAANKLASKHQRVSLSNSSSHMPNCDICQVFSWIFFIDNLCLFSWCFDCWFWLQFFSFSCKRVGKFCGVFINVFCKLSSVYVVLLRHNFVLQIKEMDHGLICKWLELTLNNITVLLITGEMTTMIAIK